MHLQSYMRYFYHYGRTFIRILTIFVIYFQLIYLFYNLVSFDQQKGKFIMGTIYNTSKLTKHNTDFWAKAIVLIFSCYFSNIVCNKKSISTTRYKSIIWGIVFIALHHNEANQNIEKKLKECTSCTFFSQESILLGNLLSKLHSHDELVFFTIFKVKKKTHSIKTV